MIDLIILAIRVITLVITIFLLLYQHIVDWFQDNTELVQKDKDNIGFTLKELYQAGDYKVVQGVFNQRTNQVVTGRRIHAQTIDQPMEETHRYKPLVIYPQ